MGKGEGAVTTAAASNPETGSRQGAKIGEGSLGGGERTAAPSLITLDRVSMVFEGKRVLSEVSVEIPEGEILGIIGRSGAGKTVLMHLIRGVDQPPTSGRVIYHIAHCA
ncbi:MAG: ATP-binding cassette domain-containing protein, partial [Methanoregulaceae archaeon]